jgi:Transglycosylase SLT domain
VLEIEVDDSAFKRFYELFSEYSAEVERQPEAWRAARAAMDESSKAIGEGATSAKESFALAAAQAGVISEALRDAVKAQADLGRESTATNKSMAGIVKNVQGIGKGISFVVGGILKLGALGGLGALVSGFGIGELASAAFSRYRTAGRAGVSPGAYASFEVNAKQFLTPAALENAANAQIDVTKAGYLAALGISYSHAQALSPGDLAFEELKSAVRAYHDARKRGLPALQMPAVASYLALGGDIGDIRNADLNGGIPALNAAEAATRRDQGALGFSRKTAQEWTNLDIALDRAGVRIQSSLIDGLAPLAPEIEKVADALSGVIDAALRSPEVKKGLEEFADFLGSKEFKDDLNDFGQALHVVISEVRKWFPQDFNVIGTGGKHGLLNASDWANTDGAKWVRGILHGLGNAWHVVTGTLGDKILSGTGKAGVDVLRVASQLGVDPLLALATAFQESGLNPNAKGDVTKGGRPTSFGLFQLHEGGELGQLTIEQALNPIINARRALATIAQVMHAHPNWSPGQIAANAQRPKDKQAYARSVDAIYQHLAGTMIDNVISTVDADIKKYGKDWTKHLPSDVAAFVGAAHLTSAERSSSDTHLVNKALRSLLKRPTQKPVRVSVTNQTGARVAISLNAAAIG